MDLVVYLVVATGPTLANPNSTKTTNSPHGKCHSGLMSFYEIISFGTLMPSKLQATLCSTWGSLTTSQCMHVTVTSSFRRATRHSKCCWEIMVGLLTPQTHQFPSVARSIPIQQV